MTLADKIEAAERGSRELDLLVAQWARDNRIDLTPFYPGPINYDVALWLERHDWSPTTSIDAAMTLVPEGWMRFDVDATAPELGVDWTLHGRKQSATGTAATPALALCAAALRAKAQADG